MIKTKVLHVFPESFLIDSIIDQFKVSFLDNIFLVPKSYNGKYTSMKEVVYIENYLQLVIEIKKIKNGIVIFHSLPVNRYFYLFFINRNVKIWWISWGYDIYNNYIINKKLYFDMTNIAIRNKYWDSEDKKYSIKNIIKKIILYNIKQIINIDKGQFFYKICFSKINYMSTLLLEEFEYVRKVPYMPKNYIYFHYYAEYNQLLDIPISKKMNYVLVGNSATPTNNHLDAFSALESNIQIDTKIICPLSYGNNSYRNYIISEGQRLFGKNFIPLTKYIKPNSYYKIIAKCNIAIFANIRQQALGNIYACLFFGSKIFFSNKSILYMHFKKNGFRIYCLEDDLSRNEFSSMLDKKDILYNREKVLHVMKENVIKDAIEYIINKA